MSASIVFTRILFGFLSIIFITVFLVAHPSPGLFPSIIEGVIGGILFTGLLIGFDYLVRRYNLRSFNTAILGLFIGYLMGLALLFLFDAIVDFSHLKESLHSEALEMVKLLLLLFGTYLGTIMTLRSSDEIYVSIPFVRFTPTEEKQKGFVIDPSSLYDARIIDLCATHVFDKQLILPRFLIKEFYSQAETGEPRARRALDTIKKLEELPGLTLRFHDTDFPEVKECTQKCIRLARLLDANLLTADISRVEMATIEGIQIINLHALSNALKPLQESGETITIKVQRYGKEPNQGVGYLEDGTMVVVNGGGDYIGETITCNVLSVKHTSSGRMIFCNAEDHHE